MGLTKTLARAAFGGYFAFNGVHHFREMKNLKGIVESKDVPCPELMLQSSGLLLIASGVSLGLGIKPKLGAAGIALFLLGANLKMHNFWTKPDIDRRYKELEKFSKNLALIAATVAIGADAASEKPCEAEVCHAEAA